MVKLTVTSRLPLLPPLPLLHPLPLLRHLAPLTLLIRPQIRPPPPRARPTANASLSAPKAQKLCTQLTSGIEHPPSLLGNFLTSESGFRCLAIVLPIFGVVSIGCHYSLGCLALCCFFPFVAFAIVESFVFNACFISLDPLRYLLVDLPFFSLISFFLVFGFSTFSHSHLSVCQLSRHSLPS